MSAPQTVEGHLPVPFTIRLYILAASVYAGGLWCSCGILAQPVGSWSRFPVSAFQAARCSLSSSPGLSAHARMVGSRSASASRNLCRRARIWPAAQMMKALASVLVTGCSILQSFPEFKARNSHMVIE